MVTSCPPEQKAFLRVQWADSCVGGLEEALVALQRRQRWFPLRENRADVVQLIEMRTLALYFENSGAEFGLKIQREPPSLPFSWQPRTLPSEGEAPGTRRQCSPPFFLAHTHSHQPNLVG